jgi:hypothetical protein
MKTKSVIASTLLLTAIPATAGTTAPSTGNTELIATTESEWRVGTSMYGWFTSLDGDMTFRGITVPVDVPFDKIFDNLKFAFMGNVEVGKGKWSFMSDLFYAKLEPSVGQRFLTFDSQIEQFIGNFAVFYNIVENPATRLDVYGGARVNWMETDVKISANRTGATIFSNSGDDTWVDPIIGFRVHHDLNEKFFVRALADIGGFGIESDLTWQAMASVGYRISENASIGLGYRGLGTDYSNSNATYDIISHGLLLGLEYKF